MSPLAPHSREEKGCCGGVADRVPKFCTARGRLATVTEHQGVRVEGEPRCPTSCYLTRWPLCAPVLGLTGEGYLDQLDDVHWALGYGRMAKSRQKVSRWENGVNSPELPARYAMACLHGIPREAVTEPRLAGFPAVGLSR